MPPKREPIVATGRCSSQTRSEARATTKIGPGTRGPRRRSNTSRTMEPAPMANACRSKDEACRPYAAHFSTKSAGTLSMLKPKKSLICEEKMISAIPEVNPVVTG